MEPKEGAPTSSGNYTHSPLCLVHPSSLFKDVPSDWRLGKKNIKLKMYDGTADCVNSANHCGDGRDEGAQLRNSMRKVEELPEQLCTVCSCQPGSTLSPTYGQCKDTDKCALLSSCA